MADTVLVSGGSGYIAGFLIRQLVAEGWMVRTTIRSLAKEEAVRKMLAVDNSRLRFFAADLTHDDGWAEAMAGCTHVAHVASPLPGRVVKDPDELIVPAREGALRALRAAKAAGARRFVMTSSVAAIGYGRGRGVHTFTKADWTPPDLLVRFGALFDPLVKAVVNELGSVRNMDSSHARAVLGWIPRPAEESIVDTARSLIDLGIVKP